MGSERVARDGEYFEALNQAVVAAFPERDELKQLVQYEFSWRLENRVDISRAYHPVMFDLLNILEGDGDLLAFVRAIWMVRPRNAECLAFIKKHEPALLSEPSEQDAARCAHEGLSVIARNRETPQVRAVLLDIRDDLSSAAASVLLLRAMKCLHERLHQIDFGIQRVLEISIRAYLQNPTGVDERFELNAVTEDLATEVERARRIVDELPSVEQPVVSGWVQKLEMAVDRLRGTLTGKFSDPQQPVRALIRPTLGQAPTMVHLRLFEEVKRLPLRRLVSAIEQLFPIFAGSDANSLSSCLSAITTLDARLRTVVNEHNFWQKIDNDLRLIEDQCRIQPISSPSWLDDLLILLPTVVEEVKTLCSLRVGEPWAARVVANESDLRQALEASQVPRIRIGFDNYQRAVRGRFYDTDGELLALCSSLVTMNGPLSELTQLGDMP